MSELNSKLAELHKQFDYLKLDEPLAPHTYWKIGGTARAFLHPPTTNEFIKALEVSHRLGIQAVVIGGGSNILISDRGFDGLVIRSGGRDCQQTDEFEITCDAGVPLSALLNTAAKAGLTMDRIDLMVGIPGTVGAAIFGNAGSTDIAIGKTVASVLMWRPDLGTQTVSRHDCQFGYRTSRFKKTNEIILRGTFEFSLGDPIQIRTEMERGLLQKRASQPLSLPSSGSVFKNPPGQSAWKLIDEAGLRGKQIGGAMVSDIHTNFIVNTGGATAEDVVILISLIKQQVRDRFNIQLQEEIQYIGF